MIQQLGALLAKLIAGEVEFVLVGGLAASLHGSSLTTRDIDVCCRFDEASLSRLERALSDLHPVHRMRPDLSFTASSGQLAGIKNLYLKTDLGILDCLGEVSGVGAFEEVWEHSIELTLPIGVIRILDLETLIKAKDAMGRPHDKITAAQLRAIQAALSSD